MMSAVRCLYEHYLTAILQTQDVPYFNVDNTRPPSGYFKETDFCDYSAFTMSVNPGLHKVSAPHGFSLLCYGYGDADSYGYAAGVRIVPDDSFSTGGLNFGNVRVQKAVDSSVGITNNGTNSVSISGATIVGPDSAFFHMLNDPVPATLQGDSALTFTIQFQPQSTRSYQAFLQICTDEDITLVPLAGTGKAAHLVLIPPVTNWGLRAALHRYDSTLTLKNIGNDSARVDSIVVVGGDTSAFSVVSSGFTLLPNTERTLSVDFHPPASTVYTDSIAVLSDSPDSSVQALVMGDASGLTLEDDSIPYGVKLLNSDTVGSGIHNQYRRPSCSN